MGEGGSAHVANGGQVPGEHPVPLVLRGRLEGGPAGPAPGDEGHAVQATHDPDRFIDTATNVQFEVPGGTRIPMTQTTDGHYVVTSEDDDRLVFTLDGGNADFPYIMSDYHLTIVPAGTAGDDWIKGIGTGAYIQSKFEPGMVSVGKRNPNFFKEGRAHFDEVEMLVNRYSVDFQAFCDKDGALCHLHVIPRGPTDRLPPPPKKELSARMDLPFFGIIDMSHARVIRPHGHDDGDGVLIAGLDGSVWSIAVSDTL